MLCQFLFFVNSSASILLSRPPVPPSCFFLHAFSPLNPSSSSIVFLPSFFLNPSSSIILSHSFCPIPSVPFLLSRSWFLFFSILVLRQPLLLDPSASILLSRCFFIGPSFSPLLLPRSLFFDLPASIRFSSSTHPPRSLFGRAFLLSSSPWIPLTQSLFLFSFYSFGAL